MKSPGRLVFDVGGTKLRGAVYRHDAADGAGALSDFRSVDAPSYLRHPDQAWPELRARLVADMSALRAALDPARAIPSATVAFPGPLDAERRVMAAPTLWGKLGSYPYPLEQDLERAWSTVRVRVLNDVTAAGYRYMRDRADEFCVVTVSTGIGNKVFVAGRPLLGPSGRGGEMGHLQIDASAGAAACDCGGRGHLGAIASGRGVLARAVLRAADAASGFSGSSLVREAQLTPATLTAEALAAAYRQGDPWTALLVEEAASALGLALAATHLSIGVDRFVLIGGFAIGLGSRFRDAVTSAIDARCWQGAPGGATVVLGYDDGLCALLGGGRAQELDLLA